MLKAIFIAFSMYSAIPMPQFEWDKKSLKFVLCFFPLVGFAIILSFFIANYFLNRLDFNSIFKTVIFVTLPFLITGGIHIDGFIDTADAISSRKPVEDKLKILKDSNVGAFGVIYFVIYVLLMSGFINQVISKNVEEIFPVFILSRAFTVFSLACLKCAKNSGLAYIFTDSSSKKLSFISSILYMLIYLFIEYHLNNRLGIDFIVLGFIGVFIYKKFCKYHFGGITGDTSGFFITIFELSYIFIKAVKVLS